MYDNLYYICIDDYSSSIDTKTHHKLKLLV